MKADIHPKYYPEAKVSCACGAVFAVGSTSPELHIEVCGNCHPFYTGAEKVMDTAGRVERFKTKMAKKTAAPRIKKTIKIAKKKSKK